MELSSRVAVVAGASGAVGSALLPRLLPRYARVVALTRRALCLRASTLEEVPAHFDALDEALRGRQAMEPDVFCALGTTLRRAGSPEAFRRVDLDAVVALARWATRVDAQSFVVVSAVGADAHSASFYSRTKGEMEEELRKLSLRRLVIVRPSLLRAARDEWRAGEWLALQAARPLGRLIPASLRPVSVDDVAAAMLRAVSGTEQVAVLENAQLIGASEVQDRGARSG